MRASLFAALLFLSATVAAATVPDRQASAPHHPGDMPAVIEADFDRITAHLAAVESRLRDAPVGHLSPSQRQARAENLDRLREYRLRGEFPHNHDYGDRMPYLRDRHGTLCAMAYLIARSGSAALVERVARDANNAYVLDLAGDPELAAWLEANGLTAEEAALVQPTYGPAPERPFSFFRAIDENYTAWALGAMAMDAIGLVLNRPSARAIGSRGLRGAVAVAAGTASASVGFFGLGQSEAKGELLGLGNLGLGVVTMAVGVQSILEDFSGEPGPVTTSARSDLKIQPMVIDERPGMRLSLSF